MSRLWQEGDGEAEPLLEGSQAECDVLTEAQVLSAERGSTAARREPPP